MSCLLSNKECLTLSKLIYMVSFKYEQTPLELIEIQKKLDKAIMDSDESSEEDEDDDSEEDEDDSSEVKEDVEFLRAEDFRDFPPLSVDDEVCCGKSLLVISKEYVYLLNRDTLQILESGKVKNLQLVRYSGSIEFKYTNKPCNFLTLKVSKYPKCWLEMCSPSQVYELV